MGVKGFTIAATLICAAPCLGQETVADAFKRACGVCHTVEPNAHARQGPNLSGIYGRASGQVAGFKYSEALAGAKLTWDDATLDRWLTNPAAMVPGTIMAYRQRDQEKRAEIIAYLKSVGGK
jgi:cytochrome c